MGKIAGSIDAIIWASKVMGAATLKSVFGNYGLNATCHDCGQSKELDVGPHKDKYGEVSEIPRLNKMLKCTKCPSPNGSVVQLCNLKTVKMG